MSESHFKKGDLVIKSNGDYTFEGVIDVAFTTQSGAWRYVVEDDLGLLMIMSAKQLKRKS